MHTIIRDNYDPTPNEYHETIVVDEARGKRWLFDCDGVFQDITNVKVVSERGESEDYAASQKWVTEEVQALEDADQALQDNLDAEEAARIAADETLQDNIDAEEADRTAADIEIWDEIEALEAASDVVDIVGTYEELEDYDTSALKDNDIIKVLQDETHDDAIAYYRWNDSSDEFVFVGVEGPYYTASETDTLLAGKVDKTSITSTPSFNPASASETLVMSQKGVAKQVLNENNGGIQISCAGGNAIAGSPVSVAIGPGAEAHASPSVAIGGTAKATGAVSVAIGNTSTAENAYSVAVGSNSKASGYSSTALGAYSTAKGPDDIAIGYNSTTAVDSGTQTNNNVAIGTASVKANGGNSFAAGAQNVKATGNDSLAIGARYVEATGPDSIAIGGGASSSADKTSASGSTSLAVGQYSSATNDLDVAIGQRAVANGYSSMAIGHNCTASSATATGTAAQQNIAIGQYASATGGYSTAFGNIAVASGETSFAVGVRANATATRSVAIGTGSPNNEVEASGSYSLAIGTNGAKASGSNSMAIGGSSTASGTYSIAIGSQSCTASHDNSVALGSNSQTGRSNEISIGTPISGGNPEKTKYIAHVTAGVNDTDAVNVAQLNAAIPGAMTGATSSAAGTSGLVPAPAAGDDVKYLAGDGTWKTVSAGSVTMFYNNFDSLTATMYSDSAMTTAVKGEDIENAFNQGKVIICCVSSNANRYIEATGLIHYSWNTSMLAVETALRSDRVLLWFTYVDKATTSCSRTSQTLQTSFTLGSNLYWIGNTLNATDTTYSDFGGATASVAGSAGLVPAPTTSDPDKYLKGDGTWSTLPAANNINSTDWNALWQ